MAAMGVAEFTLSSIAWKVSAKQNWGTAMSRGKMLRETPQRTGKIRENNDMIASWKGEWLSETTEFEITSRLLCGESHKGGKCFTRLLLCASDSSSVKGDKIAPSHDVAGRMGDLTDGHTGNSAQHTPALCKGSLSSSLPLSWQVRAAHSRGVIG